MRSKKARFASNENGISFRIRSGHHRVSQSHSNLIGMNKAKKTDFH